MPDNYEKIEFSVGGTTFDTNFFIQIPDYGVPIPECHSSGPIMVPFSQPVYNIFNYINRGIRVQMKLEDAERLYFFVLEYNRQCKKINEEAGEIVNPPADAVEAYLSKKMIYKMAKEHVDSSKTTPNPFRSQIAPLHKDDNNYKMSNDKVLDMIGSKKRTRIRPKIRHFGEEKAYDIFNVPGIPGPNGELNIPNDIDNSPDGITKEIAELDLGGARS